MLKNEYLVAKIGFDTAENGPSEVSVSNKPPTPTPSPPGVKDTSNKQTSMSILSIPNPESISANWSSQQNTPASANYTNYHKFNNREFWNFKTQE